MARTMALVLTGGVTSERTASALKLAERVLNRGHRVTVFAHDDATALSAGSGEIAEAVTSLLRRGLHGGTLDWVVDGNAAQRLGVGDRQVPGVVTGDHADLWAFVRSADVVLTAGGAP